MTSAATHIVCRPIPAGDGRAFGPGDLVDAREWRNLDALVFQGRLRALGDPNAERELNIARARIEQLEEELAAKTEAQTPAPPEGLSPRTRREAALQDLGRLEDVDEKHIQGLVDAGVLGVADIVAMTSDELVAIKGIGDKTAERLQEAAEKLLSRPDPVAEVPPEASASEEPAPVGPPSDDGGASE